MDRPSKPAWRAIGFWLAVAIALLQAFNAFRAFTDPAGFADYLGLPLTAGEDAGWVFIYGLRTLFIALAVATLLIRQDLRALTWIALAGVVMPLGDAWLTHQAQAPLAIVARHGAIAVYLLITFIALRLWTQRHMKA
jgi:hypothetical protein